MAPNWPRLLTSAIREVELTHLASSIAHAAVTAPAEREQGLTTITRGTLREREQKTLPALERSDASNLQRRNPWVARSRAFIG